ncbi:MAG: hypothetical protein LBO70_08050 [Clostridiales Family XIII bacterium]|jgi:hypothetical protein|nr:hypothetical protein [Clostridiales Family XIII bacterium]
MDDYCFRKIKSSALVMIALAAVHIAISYPLGYYWNALQAYLSGMELTASGVPEAGDSPLGTVIYLLVFGAVAALAFMNYPYRTNILRRLVLIVPLCIYLISIYVEYEKVSPIGEKFKDLYDSIEYAIFIPYAALAAITAIYLLLVIILPSLRITQGFGWVTAIIAVLSYLGSAIFIIYNHTITILNGKFGEGDFYMYLVAFALDVVSYFFMLSVLMTYCMIKREERWDRLESLEMEAELIEEETEIHEIYEPPTVSTYLERRVIPDIEDLKEHEVPTAEDYDRYRRAIEGAGRANRSKDSADKVRVGADNIAGRANRSKDSADKARVGADKIAGRANRSKDSADKVAGRANRAKDGADTLRTAVQPRRSVNPKKK